MPQISALASTGVAHDSDVRCLEKLLKTRFEVVREAIDVLFRRLERVPSSDRTEELRASVREEQASGARRRRLIESGTRS